MASNELHELIRKHALKNAMDYGKADPSIVLNKTIAAAKKDGIGIQQLRAEIESVVKEVNSMGKEELEKSYGAYSAEFESADKEKREKSAKPRMILEGAVEGDFATRFPPEPNGYMHIGHAKPLFLEAAFRDIYKGKLFLYFDDTNPKKEKQEYVDAIKKDLEWLGVEFDKEYYASDSVPKTYDLCRKLIKDGNAYACSCSAEEIKKLRFEGRACAHRDRPAEESLEIFESILSNSHTKDDVVIRFRGDMSAANTTLRDPNIFRIVREKHYRQGDKYILWPTYSFNTPINDSLNGVTDVIRSKEYELGDELYRMVLKALGLRVPRLHLESRFNIEGNVTSKRKLVEWISKGLISGFDDPRLVTISALRRRGIVPGAIKEFVLRQGMSKVDSTMRLSMLLDENKRLVDEKAKRLFFVTEPAELDFDDESIGNVSIPLHPSNAALGSRSYYIKGSRVMINSEDAESYSGKEVRLKGIGVIKLEKKDGVYRAERVTDTKGYVNTIQWIPEDSQEATVVIPGNPAKSDGEFDPESLKDIKGVIEPYASKLDIGEVVQLERFGFAVIDGKDPMRLIFMTK
ncbi:MAG: glutamate--tRNA ligase [Candidatus Micrarchaeum sp. ARMAN-1]|nr:MAG: glutamate--tRNA ligase [Candidatus Micrarchaeum sp. ARMAN-1]